MVVDFQPVEASKHVSHLVSHRPDHAGGILEGVSVDDELCDATVNSPKDRGDAVRLARPLKLHRPRDADQVDPYLEVTEACVSE